VALDDEDSSPYPSDGEPNESSPGVTDTDDGGAIVKTDDDEDEPPADESDFFRNLVPELDPSQLSQFTAELLERIEYDKESRKGRDKQYDEGIKRTGLAGEDVSAPAFDGGSKATHPMLSKAILYYQSHTIGELMPPNGPVKDWIPGKSTPERVEKAERKTAHMNWQFRKQMPEFRSQLEKLLSQQLPAGSQYMRLVYDSDKKRPVPTFWPIDQVLIPDAATDFYSAERRTLIDTITQHELESRIRQGYYAKTSLIAASQVPEGTQAEKTTNKVQGKDSTSPTNQDGVRRIYVVEVLAELEDTDRLRVAGDQRSADPDIDSIISREGAKPYLIEVDPLAREILRAVRNWEEDDEKCENLCWLVDFECLPWRGAQSVGLIHYAGSLAGASTGSLRALLDTAHVNNLPTLLRLKGTASSGQTLNLNVCGVTEIEGAAIGDQDIRKILMAVPFNPPSTMLYQLLGWCTEQGEALVRTTFENLSEDGSPNMPVGTTLALIEQGLKVLSAIHMRLHGAMDRLVGILHRINRMYITDEEILDDTGEMLAYRADYEGPVDVVPVSDPQVFSDIQRFAQLQIIQQRADLHPELYDARKVETLILERTKIPNAVDLLKPETQAQELNAVNENVAMTLGRPVIAQPEQDHLAHIQVLLDYMLSPFFGMLSIIAPKYIPAALAHLVEHLAYWYMATTVELGSKAATDATGKPQDLGKLTAFQDPDTSKQMDQLLAEASHHVMDTAKQVLSKIPPAIQQAQQLLQSLSPPPMQDPGQAALAVAKENTQGKVQAIQAKGQQDQQTVQSKNQAMLQQTAMEQQGEAQDTAAKIQSQEQINAADNTTALEISAAKIETGHSTDLSTGTGIAGRGGPE
jgi:chaperonin GroES